MTDIWEFDVLGSTHDLLQQGQCEPFRTRIVLSKAEFPDHTIASETAAMWHMSGKGDRLTTNVLTRI